MRASLAVITFACMSLLRAAIWAFSIRCRLAMTVAATAFAILADASELGALAAISTKSVSGSHFHRHDRRMGEVQPPLHAGQHRGTDASRAWRSPSQSGRATSPT